MTEVKTGMVDLVDLLKINAYLDAELAASRPPENPKGRRK